MYEDEIDPEHNVSQISPEANLSTEDPSFTQADPALTSASDPGLTPASDPETVDLDGNGVTESLVTILANGGYVVLTDLDGDLEADALIIDSNGDGQPDLVVVDLGDGTYQVSADTNGDGQLDAEQIVTRDEVAAIGPSIPDLLDSLIPSGSQETPAPQAREPQDPVTPEPNQTQAPTVQDGQVVGDPALWSEQWFDQMVNGFCGPASAAQIVGAYTGEDFSDPLVFVQEANELGIWAVGEEGVPGITTHGMEQLLEANGIPATVEENMTMQDLEAYVADGHGVILFIDGEEIWYDQGVEGDKTPNHFVVMSAIDYERGVVILSDPGTPDGDQYEVPLELFEAAWQDSNNEAIVCDVPVDDFQEQTGIAPEAVSTTGGGNAAAASDAPQSGVDLGPGQFEITPPGPLDTLQAYVSAHPWVLVPVVLAAGSLIHSHARNRSGQ